MTDDPLRRVDKKHALMPLTDLEHDLAAALRAERDARENAIRIADNAVERAERAEAERVALRALLRDLREALGHEMSIDETERIDAALGKP